MNATATAPPLDRLLVAHIFFPGQECNANQSVVGYHLRRKIENSPALINQAFCLRVSLILALSHDRMVEQKMLWFDQDANIAGTK